VTDREGLSATVLKILQARVYEVANETPLDHAPKLSKRLGRDVRIKREDLQPIFSFKIRGAYNKIASLSPEEGRRGIVAASAGNHAQGVALAASRLGYPAAIVMPRTTPRIKVDAVAALGAEVILHGDSYDEALAEAHRLREARGAVFAPPYDDEDVIAGQGTVAVEILRQHPEPIDAIFVPVGGGGLLAGVVAYTKWLRPETRVIGVEPEDAACLAAALEAGRPVPLDHVGLFADGVAVRQVGDAPFRIVSEHVDGLVQVNVDEICAAILDLFEDTRVLAEPAGALAVAGLKKWVGERDEDGIASAGSLVAIQSGANVHFHRLRHISERAELGEGRESIFAVTIPERPGSFRELCRALGERSITEFNYRYAGPGDAHVFVGVQLSRGVEERREIAAQLTEQHFGVNDLSENELALLHTRHMVGGRTGELPNERLLEHHPLPLPQPRRRTGARARGHRRPPRRRRRLPELPRDARLLLRGRESEPGLPALPLGPIGSRRV
jgi:threonine dehydratase